MAPPPRKLLLLLAVAVVPVLVSLAAAPNGGYLGDAYIECLEMGFSRCFANPTLICLEECSKQAAAAAPAAPTATGAEAELVLGGVITRGITYLSASYFNCLEAELAGKCFRDPTTRCVEDAIGAC